MKSKTKNYNQGRFYLKAYYKTAGNGYEIGLNFGNKPIFWGHFFSANEANTFWRTFNANIKTFGSRFKFPAETASSWYSKFIANHVEKHYVQFINRRIDFKSKKVEKLLKNDLKKWNKLNKKNHYNKQSYTLKAA